MGKSSHKIIIITLLSLFYCCTAFCQVSFQFVPEIYGRNVNGLFNCRINNPTGRKTATLSIEVTEKKNGTIALVRTQPFTLNPGSNIIPVSAVRSATVQYPNNNIGVIIKHNQDFPIGDYEYCFTLNFNVAANETLAEQCFEYELIPFAELNLLEPYDKDSVCDARPMLTWQPLLPAVQGSYYQLVLSEVKSDQNAVEALNYNLPIINQSHLISPILPYPAIDEQLQEGKTYAWQVTAYKDQTILNRSEIWTFTEHCKDPTKKLDTLKDDGYRDINDLVKGNYYIAVAYMKFALINPYQAKILKYQIVELNNPTRKISGLPKVTLIRGRNKIKIDLFNTDSFTDGESYILQLQLPDGTEKDLRFVYRDQ